MLSVLFLPLLGGARAGDFPAVQRQIILLNSGRPLEARSPVDVGTITCESTPMTVACRGTAAPLACTLRKAQGGQNVGELRLVREGEKLITEAGVPACDGARLWLEATLLTG